MEEKKELIFEGLNSAQASAVENFEGPCLIIAGAGSGKTKVLTCRIANIIQHGVPPEQILALTFTNKAAQEMRQRITAAVGRKLTFNLLAGTFHSIFIKFLREESELIGFPKDFTIYDTSDSKALIKACIKELQLDDKTYKPADVLSRISKAKNNLVTYQAYANNAAAIQADKASKRPLLYQVYELYARKCRQNGAMDFDDILLYTNILFRDHEDALKRIGSRFRYILVDEYQDTNFAQYIIVKKLASFHHNIAVVGDDAQSIYSFRGARIENIINFRKDYPDCSEYRLEQNYRSTKTIVNAANSVISHNRMQLKKTCFSKGDEGELIELLGAYSEKEEGMMVASSIASAIYRSREPYSHFAVLYRTNAQSRIIEEELRRRNMPYRIYAGHSFYERQEIKDMIAYIKLIVNPRDNESFRRIINFPTRAIGDTSQERLMAAAGAAGVCAMEFIFRDARNKEKPGAAMIAAGIKEATARKIMDFARNIVELRSRLLTEDAYTMAGEIDSRFGIIASLKAENTIESESRAENIEELFNSIQDFVDNGQEENDELVAQGYEPVLVTLDMYLQNVSLISDLDVDEDKDQDCISLMTVHSSKGLEFEHVYIMGMEENLFPGQAAVSMLAYADNTEMEEERRLFYVALTRAKKDVKLSYTHQRKKFGETVSNSPSRFIKEIDPEYVSNPIPDYERELSTDSASRSAFLHRGTSGAPTRPSFTARDMFSTPHSASSGNGTANGRSSYGNSKPVQTNAPQQKSAPGAARNFMADSPAKIKPGHTVEHPRFGIGKVLSLEGDIMGRKAIVRFSDGSTKTLVLAYAKLRIVQ